MNRRKFLIGTAASAVALTAAAATAVAGPKNLHRFHIHEVEFTDQEMLEHPDWCLTQVDQLFDQMLRDIDSDRLLGKIVWRQRPTRRYERDFDRDDIRFRLSCRYHVIRNADNAETAVALGMIPAYRSDDPDTWGSEYNPDKEQRLLWAEDGTEEIMNARYEARRIARMRREGIPAVY